MIMDNFFMCGILSHLLVFLTQYYYVHLIIQNSGQRTADLEKCTSQPNPIMDSADNKM